MNDTPNTVLVFIQKQIPEAEIVSFLQAYLKIAIDSDRTDTKNAAAFLQYANYEDDFATMITLTSRERYAGDKDIAQAISVAFKTHTLIELPDCVNGFDYLLIAENRNEEPVKIRESEAGIRLANRVLKP